MSSSFFDCVFHRFCEIKSIKVFVVGITNTRASITTLADTASLKYYHNFTIELSIFYKNNHVMPRDVNTKITQYYVIHNTKYKVRPMHPGLVFHAVEFTLWEYENKLDRKYIFSLWSSMVSISISISFRTAWSSAIQFRIFVSSKRYALICNRTWLKAGFTAKHFYIKSAIKRIQFKGS